VKWTGCLNTMNLEASDSHDTAARDLRRFAIPVPQGTGVHCGAPAIDVADPRIRAMVRRPAGEPNAVIAKWRHEVLFAIFMLLRRVLVTFGVKAPRPPRRVFVATGMFTFSRKRALRCALRTAERLIGDQRHREAGAILAWIVRRWPRYQPAWYYRGLIYYRTARFEAAMRALERALRFGRGDPNTLRLLGDAALVAGDEAYAGLCYRQMVAVDPRMAVPHQNYAARIGTQDYFAPAAQKPKVEWLLYDASNRIGEELTHIGLGDWGVALFGKALRVQSHLEAELDIDPAVRSMLIDRCGIGSRPFRLLPQEWVTQIGHTAMLDCYLKIMHLGWRPKRDLVLLAPPQSTANTAFVDCWRQHVTVIEDDVLIHELMPLQRHIGDTFNGVLNDDGTVSAFTDRAAQAMAAWDSFGRNPLVAPSPRVIDTGKAFLRGLGFGDGDWFVALHCRSPGYYGESGGQGHGHRNSPISDYLPAIREITQRGAWVVRMGDPTMEPLPRLDRVIDYAHLRNRSPELDVFFAACARYFVGTTSGLTNVAISFATPCLLLNCISNYAQLWDANVIFSLKRMRWRAAGRYLSLSEMTAPSVLWSTFNDALLGKLGIDVVNNSRDEILELVKEMLARVDGRPPSISDDLSLRWTRALPQPFHYGGARPAASFLARHHETLLP
jgi:putative glycosyltransferase (TIGR04372 family)